MRGLESKKLAYFGCQRFQPGKGYLQLFPEILPKCSLISPMFSNNSLRGWRIKHRNLWSRALLWKKPVEAWSSGCSLESQQSFL